MSTFAIADFTALLHDLVKQKRIMMKVVRNRMYYMEQESQMAKCPSCREIFEPKKLDGRGIPGYNGKSLSATYRSPRVPKTWNFQKGSGQKNNLKCVFSRFLTSFLICRLFYRQNLCSSSLRMGTSLRIENKVDILRELRFLLFLRILR